MSYNYRAVQKNISHKGKNTISFDCID